MTHVPAHLQYALAAREEFSLIEAVASLLVFQWSRLNWPMPCRITWIPQRQQNDSLREIAALFAQMLSVPLTEEFRLRWSSPFQWRLKRRGEELLEGKRILLIDEGGSLDWLHSALAELAPAFPEEIHILTLFPP